MKPVHARLARAALRWSLVELEEKTGISKNTLVRFESGGGVNHSTVVKIEEAFTKEGVIFVYEDGNRGPGVLLSLKLSHAIDETASALAKSRSTRGKKKRK